MEIPIFDAGWPIALILLGLVIYLVITWNHGYWKKRGVPYIKPLPILGNLKDSFLGKKSIGEVYSDLYWKFDGRRYAGIFAPIAPSLLIRDPELIKEILVKNFASFHDNTFELDINADPMFGRNPFVLRGERWKVSHLLNKNDCSGEFEAKELCSRFTTDVVTTCAYGINGNSIKNPDSEFRQAGREIIDQGTFNSFKVFIAFLMPSIARIFKFRFISKRVEEFFITMVNEVMTYRKEKNVTRNDYIQHLINIKNKAETFTDIDVAAQSTTFFLDGFETSATVFSCTLYCLATNPDVQTKLRDEVNRVIQEEGGELTYEGIHKMTYLDMVLSESLRLYTPLNFLTKLCTRSIQLPTSSGEEFTVEVGTPMIIPLYALHRDPKYFPDPETFNPDHFSEENKKNRHKYAYMPFGEGPRTCL
ncbi:hypothetical protein L9F63_023895, partial [Diploptera punctata]